MKTSVIPQQWCPHCLHSVNRATAVKGKPHVPKPGDVLVCFECGGIAFIGQEGRGYIPSAAELEAWRIKAPKDHALAMRAQQHAKALAAANPKQQPN